MKRRVCLLFLISVSSAFISGSKDLGSPIDLNEMPKATVLITVFSRINSAAFGSWLNISLFNARRLNPIPNGLQVCHH